RHYLGQGAFQQAVEALATTYPEDQLPTQLVAYVQSPISTLAQDSTTKEQGQQLADRAIAFLRERMPADLNEEPQKARAREYWFAIADLQNRSGRLEAVPETYDQMLKVFGTDDSI